MNEQSLCWAFLACNLNSNIPQYLKWTMFGPSFYKLGWIKLVVGYMVESGRPAKGIVEVS